MMGAFAPNGLASLTKANLLRKVEQFVQEAATSSLCSTAGVAQQHDA